LTDSPFSTVDAQLPLYILPEASAGITVRFAPKQVGNYFDTLYIKSNAYSTPIARINIRGTGKLTGVEEQVATNHGEYALVLAPNPVKESARLIIISDEKVFQKVSVSIVDLLGRVVWTQKESNSSSNNSEVLLNTSSIPSGYYHLRVNIDTETYDLPIIKE
jgi:hypothetical protein